MIRGWRSTVARSRIVCSSRGNGLVEISVLAGLAAGHYTMVINADLEDGDVVVKEVDFVKDASGSLLIGNIRIKTRGSCEVFGRSMTYDHTTVDMCL